MKTRTKILTGIGITAILVLALVASGWFMNSAFAQGPWQGGHYSAMHNNRAVLDLLKTTESELLQQRHQGKSWLDIATAKSISEQALTDALVRSTTQLQRWMTQNYPQANIAQMTEGMRQQFAQDLRVAEFGTMTDMHVFGGSMMNGAPDSGAMMGNGNDNNGFVGMMGGMMNGTPFNGEMMGGMMNGAPDNGGMMNGGMMGGWNNTPIINATPVPSTQKIDREIRLNAGNFKFEPSQVAVNKDETIKFTITNQDKFAHNVASQDGKLTYTVLPANQATALVWVAPNQAGTYTVTCTWHLGMQFVIQVK